MCNQGRGQGLRAPSWQRAHKLTLEWRIKRQKDDSWWLHGAQQNWMWFNHKIVPVIQLQLLLTVHQALPCAAATHDTFPIFVKTSWGNRIREVHFSFFGGKKSVSYLENFFLAWPGLPRAKPNDVSPYNDTNPPIVTACSFISVSTGDIFFSTFVKWILACLGHALARENILIKLSQQPSRTNWYSPRVKYN